MKHSKKKGQLLRILACYWKASQNSKCPRCLTDNETAEHVVRCRHVDATLFWDQGIEEIETWMINHNSIPGLAEAFGIWMNQWRNNQPFTDLDQFEDSIQSIIPITTAGRNEQQRFTRMASCIGH